MGLPPARQISSLAPASHSPQSYPYTQSLGHYCGKKRKQRIPVEGVNVDEKRADGEEEEDTKVFVEGENIEIKTFFYRKSSTPIFFSLVFFIQPLTYFLFNEPSTKHLMYHFFIIFKFAKKCLKKHKQRLYKNKISQNQVRCKIPLNFVPY